MSCTCTLSRRLIEFIQGPALLGTWDCVCSAQQKNAPLERPLCPPEATHSPFSPFPPLPPGLPIGYTGVPQGTSGYPRGTPGYARGSPGVRQGTPWIPGICRNTRAPRGTPGVPPGHSGVPPGFSGVPPRYPGVPPGVPRGDLEVPRACSHPAVPRSLYYLALLPSPRGARRSLRFGP
jgi:hypothetical protein